MYKSSTSVSKSTVSSWFSRKFLFCFCNILNIYYLYFLVGNVTCIVVFAFIDSSLGAARAFGESLKPHPELVKVCRDYFGDDKPLDSPQLKMAHVRSRTYVC